MYWIEYFNSLEDAQKWIDEEQTRPYYNIDFTYEIIDQTPIKTEQDLINEKYIKIRIKRNHLLQETDHIMMPDYPMVDKSAYEQYRQELRDLPLNITDIDNIAWPEKP